ncbi:MAG: AMP-binding protein [bacterium]
MTPASSPCLFRAWPAPARPLFGEEIRYGHVYAAAGALSLAVKACNTQRLCVGTEDRFALAAAALAALKDGFSLVLPHTLHGPVLSTVCEELRCGAVLAEAELAPTTGIPRIAPPSPQEETGAPEPPLSTGQTFVSLYTGGSTGQPRVWHKRPENILTEAQVFAEHLGITPEDRVLATVTPLHIYGLIHSVLIPLTVGSRVVRETSYFPAEVEAAARREAATILVTTPPHLRLLAGALRGIPSLRFALSSGSMLQQGDAERFHVETGLGVTEGYGSTETGGVATRCRAAGQSCWTPLPGVETRVEQERLWVRSPFLSPELATDPDGFFRTGDRAQTVDSALPGQFELFGRVDGIVKVAGVRVDVDDVEQRIRALNGVIDVCVLARPVAGIRETELSAVVVTSEPLERLRRRIAAALEPAATPRRLLTTDRLPTTPPGKHDRDAIRALLDGQAQDPA